MKLWGKPALLLAVVLTVAGCSATRPAVDPSIQAKADAFASKVQGDLNASAKAVYDAKTLAVNFPTDRPLRFLLVGDSLSNGSGATEPAKSFRELVAVQLSKHATTQAVLAGKKGQGVDLIAPQGLAAGGGFDVMVVEVGTNDVGTKDPAQFATAFGAMITRLRAQSPSAALVCLGPWREGKSAAAFASAIEKACGAAGGRYRDLSQFYTDAANRWTTGVMSNGQPAEDNFHPSDAGHAKIAGEVLNVLRLDGMTY